MENWAERVRECLVEEDAIKEENQREHERIQKEAPNLFESFGSKAQKGLAELKSERPDLSGVEFVKTGDGFTVNAPSHTVAAVYREIDIKSP